MRAGVHGAGGHFRVLPHMLPRYMVPDLSGFALKPYVANYPEQAGRGRGSGVGADDGAAVAGGGGGGGSDAGR
jgi:hypothetical protein